MLHFRCQCVMPASSSDRGGRPVSHIQTYLPDMLVSLFCLIQQENVRQEERALSQSPRVQQARRAAHTFGDRLRHGHKFWVLSAWLQGDLHWPKPTVSEISEENHGRQRPPLIWEICGGIGGGHGVSWGRFGRRCCLHPGALLCQQHTANSAWGSPHTETSKSSVTPEIASCKFIPNSSAFYWGCCTDRMWSDKELCGLLDQSLNSGIA